MAELLDRLADGNAVFDHYVQRCTNDQIRQDLNGPLIENAREISLALLRQRARLRRQICELLADFDGLQQLLRILQEQVRVPEDVVRTGS